MDKIVQLKEWEYNELYKQANYNQTEIVKLAEGMYKEKGTVKMTLYIDCKQNYRDEISFEVRSYISSNGDLDKFQISYKDRAKIIKFAESKILALMQYKFGRPISDINIYNKKLELFRRWKMQFIGLTLLGWIAALTILLINNL
jgi:hypothetical protein